MIVDWIELAIDGVKIPQSFIKSFSVKSSRIERPMTLEIELVKKLNRYREAFKEKARVTLKVAYKDRYPLTKVFDGVLTKPNQERRTIKLKCEDLSYLLKEPKTITFVNLWDGDIIKRLAPGANVDNVKNRKHYRKVSFTQKSVRWIMNYLAEKSLSDWFFIADKLYYGEKYSFTKEKETSLIDLKAPYIVQNSLNWHEGVPNLKVIVVGTDEKGRPYIGKAGKGTNIRKFFDKDAGKDSVGDKAKEHYKELSFKGFRGSLKLLAEPILSHSQKVIIKEEDKEREAWIDSQTITWSPSDGLRQEIKVGEQEKETKKKAKKKAKKKGRRTRRGRRRGRRKRKIALGQRK